MSKSEDAAVGVTPGLWICGECDMPTHEAHFYEDRASGVMGHLADPDQRERARQQCGWRFDDDHGSLTRCQLSAGHPAVNHVSPHAHWRSDSLGAIPPYKHQPEADR